MYMYIKTMTTWKVTVLCLMVCLCGIHTTSSELLSRQKRVIGGTYTSVGERPWLVSLRGRIVKERLFGVFPISHRTVYCGGSLLNNRWVLTAAHCFDGGYDARDVDAWEITLATVDLEPNMADRFMNILGQFLGKEEWQLWKMGVDKIIIHPGYTTSDLWRNDIALVKLDQNVPSGPEFDKIMEITLPEHGQSSFPLIGQHCAFTGWGCTNVGGGASSRAMTVQLPIEDNRSCLRYFRPQSMAGRLCAGFRTYQRHKGICPGDSGAPLVCKNDRNQWVQVGVASFTSKDNPDKYPGVFTRVSDFVEWIKIFV